MTLFLSPSLHLSRNGTPAQRRANRRMLRRVLKDHAVVLMERHGYKIGGRLNLKSGRAYTATREGIAIKVGIRASADRWIAATRASLAEGGELSIVDELHVIVFKDATRNNVELWRFDAKLVSGMAEKVFEASGSDGQQWLPLDDTRDMGVHSMAAGSLLKHGELVDRESVEWSDEKVAVELLPDENVAAQANGYPPLTLAQAREGLAKYHGVRPEHVRIIIDY